MGVGAAPAVEGAVVGDGSAAEHGRRAAAPQQHAAQAEFRREQRGDAERHVEQHGEGPDEEDGVDGVDDGGAVLVA